MQFSDVLPGGLPPNLHVPEDWLNGSMNCHMKNGLGRKEGVNPTSRLEFNFGLNQILASEDPWLLAKQYICWEHVGSFSDLLLPSILQDCKATRPHDNCSVWCVII